MKPHLAGLLNRQGIPDGKPLSHLGGFVVDGPWWQFNPANGSYDWSEIDTAVSWIRANAPQIGLKLRIYAGVYAPDWAKKLTGTLPYTMHQPPQSFSPQSRTLPYWWSPPGSPYAKAWGSFLVALASKVEPLPEVRSINVSMVHEESAEVLLVFGDEAAYVKAGYTDINREAALMHNIGILARRAPTTHIDLALHGLHTIGSGSSYLQGWPGTYQLAADVYAAHPGELVTAFHTGLGDKTCPNGVLSSSGQQAYGVWLKNHYPFDVQTESLGNGFSNPQAILGWAAKNGLTSVELPAGWTSWAGQSWFAFVDDQLKLNATNRDKGA